MKKLLSVYLLICTATVSLSLAAAEKAPKPDADQPVVLIKTSEGNVYVELFSKSAPETVKNFLGLATGKKPFTDTSGKKVTRPFYDNLIFHRVIKNFMIQGGCPKGTGTGDPGYKFADEISGKSLGLDKLKVITNNRPHRWLLIRSQRDYYMNVLAPLYRKMGITSNEILKKRRQEILTRVKNMTLLEAYSNLGYKYNSKLKSHPLKRGVIAMANSGPNTNGSQFFINVIDTPWLTGKHTVFGRVIRGMDVVDKISKVPAGQGSKPVKPVRIISIRPFERKKVPAK